MKTAKTKKETKAEITALELHEQICAIRYENLDKRLESGSARFIRMEAMIWGLYAVIVGSYLLDKVS
tara:strand:- start:1210 stop:1410 length:201 start_codon:yes stop_codon:yes gene_type:complete